MTQQFQQLEEVNEQLTTLREQINQANTDIRACIEKRDKLNEHSKVLRQEINELKVQRDILNQNVRQLKQQRDEVRKSAQSLLDNVKAHIEKIKALREKAPRERRQELQKEFDAIEWKIQTTSLDLKEEKLLIEDVKQIETLLNVYKKMDHQSQKINELKTELKVYTDKADGFHQQLTADAQKSQELHAKMLAKFEEMKKTRDEADGLHEKFLVTKAQARPAYDQIKRLMDERVKLQEAIRIESIKEKKDKELEFKEKLGSQAKDKLERGEKLDWREFQLIAGSDPEAED